MMIITALTTAIMMYLLLMILLYGDGYGIYGLSMGLTSKDFNLAEFSILGLINFFSILKIAEDILFHEQLGPSPSFDSHRVGRKSCICREINAFQWSPLRKFKRVDAVDGIGRHEA